VLEVRRLYLRVLDRAAARGAARPPGATPYEFEPAIRRQFPVAEPAHLTEAFVRARYGLVEPTPAELQALRDEARRLE